MGLLKMPCKGRSMWELHHKMTNNYLLLHVQLVGTNSLIYWPLYFVSMLENKFLINNLF
jgi:hypothetical protein